MKLFTALLGLGVALSAGAQIADTGRPEQLMSGVHSELYNPVLSADGTQLLFSNADYSNLRIYDFASGASKSICSEARAGLDAQFSGDGKNVIYVSRRSADRLSQLRVYDIAQGSNTDIGEPARNISRPVIDAAGCRAQVDGKARKVKANPAAGVRTEGSTLFITVNGKETAYSPVPSQAGYLWESLSPDGTKVMFFAAGRGIVITDLNGKILSEPGKYEAPVWYGNNHIVAMNATDDGHQYRSSQIVLLTVDGSARQELTAPQSMTMFPTASVNAQKVVYNTIDGRIFQMTVKLK